MIAICVMRLVAKSGEPHCHWPVDGSNDSDRRKEKKGRLDLVIQREVVAEIDCEGDQLFQSNAIQNRMAIACRLVRSQLPLLRVKQIGPN